MKNSLTESILTGVRRWHGSIGDKLINIDNLVNVIKAHQPAWPIDPGLLAQLSGNCERLQALVVKCHTPEASSADREKRNTLLRSTVRLCLLQVKVWAYSQFTAGVMTATDVHLLCFLLPGETGGHRSRTEATAAEAEVKVRVLNEDFIRAVIDNSAGENAAQVSHGWPAGVRNALLVITAADGTEVCRRITTRLRTDLCMPAGSHGKQFIIKAAFLKHVSDEPRFGAEQTFSMPLTTEDLVAGGRSREDFGAPSPEQALELERLRREVTRLQAALIAAQKPKD
jgi:hypothetical protein